MQQKCRRKMGGQGSFHKVDPRFQHQDPVPVRQTGRRRLPQIHRKVKWHPGHCLGPKQAHAPRLDQTGKGGRRAGDKSVADTGHLDLIISDKNGPKADHLQGQR
jgi:hypothetical protein